MTLRRLCALFAALAVAVAVTLAATTDQIAREADSPPMTAGPESASPGPLGEDRGVAPAGPSPSIDGSEGPSSAPTAPASDAIAPPAPGVRAWPLRFIHKTSDQQPGQRAIVLRREAVERWEGPNLVATVPFDASLPVAFEDIVQAVGDPQWVGDDAGIVTLRAAFGQAEGTDLVVRAPAVRELRISNEPGVLFGGLSAAVVFERTHVTSWDIAAGGPDTEPADGRPFVLYDRGSRMNVAGAEMSHLGFERPGSSGVSWGSATSGSAVDASFHDSFTGASFRGAVDVTVSNSRFYANTTAGMRASAATGRLLVEASTVFDNLGDGITLSDGVMGAVVRKNRLERNAADGLVVRQSGGSLIVDNTATGNGRAGIRIDGAHSSLIHGNTISSSQAGIAVRGEGAENQVIANEVVGNLVGVRVQGTGGTAILQNVVRGPGHIGVVLQGSEAVLSGGSVSGVLTGADVAGRATVRDLSMREITTGVVVRNGGRADLRSVTVRARATGVIVRTGGTADVYDSELAAQRPLRGEELGVSSGNQLVAPVPRLAIVGAVIPLLACALEITRRVRERSTRTARRARLITTTSAA